jgi:putative transposase
MVPEIVMEVVDKLKGLIPIYLICESLTIPPFTYYHWKKQEETERKRNMKQKEPLVGE